VFGLTLGFSRWDGRWRLPAAPPGLSWCLLEKSSSQSGGKIIGDSSTITSLLTWGANAILDVHLKLGIFPCTLLGGLVVVVEGQRSLGRVAVAGGGAGHPWNVGEAAGGRAGQRGAAAVQQELAVVDDARSSWCCAKQSPSRRSGVIMWHMRRIVDGHSSGGRNGTASGGLLAAHGHVYKRSRTLFMKLLKSGTTAPVFLTQAVC